MENKNRMKLPEESGFPRALEGTVERERGAQTGKGEAQRSTEGRMKERLAEHGAWCLGEGLRMTRTTRLGMSESRFMEGRLGSQALSEAQASSVCTLSCCRDCSD